MGIWRDTSPGHEWNVELRCIEALFIIIIIIIIWSRLFKQFHLITLADRKHMGFTKH